MTMIQSQESAGAPPLVAIAIRAANEQDLPAVTALLAELEAGATDMPLDQARVAFARICLVPAMVVWLVEREERAVGTYTSIIIPNLGHHGAPLMIVESVVVARSERGGGVGAVMMRHAMRQAAAAGCYKLALSSNVKRVDAHRFYRRLGFAQHGVSLTVEPLPVEV